MVTVKLQRDVIVDPSGTASRTVLVGYVIEGHAGFEERGKDIVCAGVSAIAQAALLGLKDILGNRVRSVIKDGYLSVDVDKDQASEQGAYAILRGLELGLGSIAKTYPELVSVEYQDK